LKTSFGSSQNTSVTLDEIREVSRHGGHTLGEELARLETVDLLLHQVPAKRAGAHLASVVRKFVAGRSAIMIVECDPDLASLLEHLIEAEYCRQVLLSKRFVK
jgi:hypothetical protein